MSSHKANKKFTRKFLFGIVNKDTSISTPMFQDSESAGSNFQMSENFKTLVNWNELPALLQAGSPESEIRILLEKTNVSYYSWFRTTQIWRRLFTIYRINGQKQTAILRFSQKGLSYFERSSGPLTIDISAPWAIEKLVTWFERIFMTNYKRI